MRDAAADGDVRDGDVRDGRTERQPGMPGRQEARPGHDAPAQSGGLPGKHQVAGDELPGEDIRDAQRAGTPRQADGPVPGPRHGSRAGRAGLARAVSGRLTIRAG